MLNLFADAGRSPITVADYIESEAADKHERYVILRHDVDRMTSRAIAMAELEAERDIKATYYFRCSKGGIFPDGAIRAIDAMGHEVGYHYECLSACGGDRHAALRSFNRNLSSLRAIAPCRTISMHGAPLSRYNNQDLLGGAELASFELVGDASLAFMHSHIAYFTDTGGKWNGGAGENFRDRVGRAMSIHPAPSAVEFAQWLLSFRHLVYVSTHPERWASTSFQYHLFAARDKATLLVKKAIARRRLAHVI